MIPHLPDEQPIFKHFAALRTAQRVVPPTCGVLTLHAVPGDLSEAAMQASVCIRAEDVGLSARSTAGTSPRNRLPAIVSACLREGPLVALLTPQSGGELAFGKFPIAGHRKRQVESVLENG